MKKRLILLAKLRLIARTEIEPVFISNYTSLISSNLRTHENSGQFELRFDLRECVSIAERMGNRFRDIRQCDERVNSSRFFRGSSSPEASKSSRRAPVGRPLPQPMKITATHHRTSPDISPRSPAWLHQRSSPPRLSGISCNRRSQSRAAEVRVEASEFSIADLPDR